MNNNRPPWVQTNKTPPPFHYKNSASFYASTPWRNLREFKLNLDPFCEDCLQEDKLTSAEEVDHVKEIATNPELALDIKNLRSLCKPHHSSKTRKQTNKSKPPQGGIITFKTKYLNK